MFSPEPETISPASTKAPVKYGELIVLGYNGSLPNGDRGRRKSRFALCKRAKANGVKPSTVHIACTPQAAKKESEGQSEASGVETVGEEDGEMTRRWSDTATLQGGEKRWGRQSARQGGAMQAISNKDQHSVSYTLSRVQTVVVEYTHDSNTDMFQIGRSTESPIDFVVTDTVAGSQSGGEAQTAQSTISRFACRITCQRSPPHTAHVYAAGFDSSKNIFLGEKAAKWKTPDGQMDGLTTNGVLVMHPRLGFTEDSRPGVWREISVCGNVFTLRETRSAQQRGKMVENETQELVDGSLIDLCGATLLWRTAEGLSRTPTVKHLEALRQELNAARPQCPVGFNTLAFPSVRRQDAVDDRQPWAYLRCGHVHGYHSWGGGGGGARSGGRRPRVPHVPRPGPLRATAPGLRGRPLPGRGPAHARLRALRARLLGEDGGLLEPDPAAARHTHLPRRLPLLRPAAERRAGLRQAHIPGACGLGRRPPAPRLRLSEL
ncbi:hypothetical protein ANANG_G00301190 [Anguilla anguilla]|uniref:Pellino E3 ubiquitin protein ligase 1b n=1 Tax=Anguilla anguilla TaxID=7936 RepID=A0A9D3LKL6_ANGAN|nr:hypothetical protein ANANG_G00301190 [Anguilla anguilla]